MVTGSGMNIVLPGIIVGQGIATMLYQELKQEAEGKIRHTNTTDEGSLWRRSLG